MGRFTYSNKNWGPPPHAGELNQRIQIWDSKSELDADGYPVTIETMVCETWAQAILSGDANEDAAGAVGLMQAMNFTIRWRGDVKTGMWVRFNGRSWEIMALNEFDFKRNWLGMKTIAAEAISK